MSYLKTLIPDTLETYTLHYRVGRIDRYNRAMRCNIYRRGSKAVAVTNIDAVGSNGINVEYSVNDGGFFRPIAGSVCTLTLISPSYSFFLEMSTADETEWMIEVFENYGDADERLIFWGYINPESYSQDYRHINSIVQLRAVDGLALLDGVDFAPLPDNALYYQGQEGALLQVHQIKYVLAYILSQVGNRYDILNMIPWQWDARVSSSARLWDATIDVSHYWGESCRVVLEDIMRKMKAQIAAIPVQTSTTNSVFCVRFLDDVLPGNFEVLENYDRFGDWQSGVGKSGNALWPVNIITLGIDTDILPGARLESESAVRELTITTKVEKVTNLVFNHDFKLGKNNWFVTNPVAEEPLYRIMPQGYMQILSANNWNELSQKKVFTNLRAWHSDSSTFENNIRFRVRITAKRRKLPQAYLQNWFFKVTLHNADDDTIDKAFFFLNEDNWDWETFDYQFPEFARPKLLSISAISAGFNEQALHVKEVVLYAEKITGNERSDFESISNEEKHTIHEKSIRKITEEIHGNAVNQYVYQNLLVRDQSFSSSAHIPFNVKRNNTSGSSRLFVDAIKERVIDYYSRKRRKLSVSIIHNDDVRISPLSIIQDINVGITFVVSHMSRNLSTRLTTLQLYEHCDYVIAPPILENTDWILYPGSWTDTGKWYDNEQWKDSN